MQYTEIKWKHCPKLAFQISSDKPQQPSTTVDDCIDKNEKRQWWGEKKNMEVKKKEEEKEEGKRQTLWKSKEVSGIVYTYIFCETQSWLK